MRPAQNAHQSRVRLARRHRARRHRDVSRRRGMKRAVVLLSGGLDSATTLAIARVEGFETYALSFRYGQRHAQELAAAIRVARSLGAREHRVTEIDLQAFGGSALTAEID